MKRLDVIKIGGNVIDNEELLERFLDSLVSLPRPVVVIHGGGAIATKLSRKLGIEVKMVGGRRITDAPTLAIATMVYAGLINKRITAALQKRGVQAVGLSGADGDSVRAAKRKSEDIDWGYVGDVLPDGVNTAFIKGILESGATPVFCAISHDGNGSLLNTNADTMAREIASALSADFEVNLIYCFEKQGVLADPENDESFIPEIDREKYRELLDIGTIAGGMIPKMDNAFLALSHGVKKVLIKHADNITNNKHTVITL